jgi:F1F0 ATPase subunit 2
MFDIEVVNLGALAVALVSGMLLSGGYFGALWLTVRHLDNRQRPAVGLLISLLARLSLLLSGFYWILDGSHWGRILTALMGFIAVRILLMRKLRPAVNTPVAATHTKLPS